MSMSYLKRMVFMFINIIIQDLSTSHTHSNVPVASKYFRRRTDFIVSVDQILVFSIDQDQRSVTFLY